MIESNALPEVPTSMAKPKRSEISRTLIARSVVSNWSYLSLNVMVAFWMTPFVVRHLGDSWFGIWALVLQLTGYMGVVDVGLRSALVRFVSRFQAQGDHEALNRLLNTTVTVYALIAPLCFIVAAIVAFFGLIHMHIPSEMLRVAQITVFIAAGCIACDFVFATSHASLAGLSRWDLINSVWIPVLLVRTGLIILFLKLGFGLLTLASIQFSVTLIGYSVEMILLRRLLPRFRFKWRTPEMVHMRPIMEHGWYSFLLSIAARINYQVDSIVIAFFLPISQVTFYVIGLRLIEYLRDLLNSTTMIVAPIVSSLDAAGDTHYVTTTLIRSTKYSLLVGFLGVGALFGLGTDFIRLWMGETFWNCACDPRCRRTRFVHPICEFPCALRSEQTSFKRKLDHCRVDIEPRPQCGFSSPIRDSRCGSRNNHSQCDYPRLALPPILLEGFGGSLERVPAIRR
jgi:O-antigen/teichoic acid export membrane protein